MAVLYYIYDPMCSWCWAFRPVWSELQQQLPEALQVKYLLGGLAPDSDLPMPVETQTMIQQHWQTIEKKVPGTQFNYDFWTDCQPRRSTWPACRAVIAARAQGLQQEKAMIDLIQHAYYLHARNPSDDDVLLDLASILDLDVGRFQKQLNAVETQQTLMSEIRRSQSLGVTGFPSLVMENNEAYQHIGVDYNNAAAMIQQLAAELVLADPEL